MSFPYTRMRRLRKSNWIREMVAETHLKPSDLILPMFIQEGKSTSTPIEKMPGVTRHTIDNAVKIAVQAKDLGIPMIALFPVVDESKKSIEGAEAINGDNLICRCIKEIKNKVPEIGIMADGALDPYTSHGHDGVFEKGEVQNDLTVEVLVQQAITLAKTGADAVAPSDMMDGRIGAIRESLESEGFQDTIIISYAAKYASSFYGPFRDAIKSKRKDGSYLDKRSYQMDPRNTSEAMREIALDVEEGADMVIIKPGMPYLDVMTQAHANFNIPIIAYQVSGEYAMLKFASEAGAFDFQQAMLESLLAFKRAGSSAIITYSALQVAAGL